MVAHQPADQAGVPLRQLVTATEGFHVFRPQFRVIAATALGDVVVETGDVDQLRLGSLWITRVASGYFSARTS